MAKIEFKDEQELFRFVMQNAKCDYFDDDAELIIHIKAGEKMTISIKPPKNNGLTPVSYKEPKMQVSVK